MNEDRKCSLCGEIFKFPSIMKKHKKRCNGDNKIIATATIEATEATESIITEDFLYKKPDILEHVASRIAHHITRSCSLQSLNISLCDVSTQTDPMDYYNKEESMLANSSISVMKGYVY